ncbi:MAG TPA: type I restriction-modification enzyme R subunit C-terminal domain-containing protein [Archangium sp.]|uniref:type I restriction endonuclease subunit R n=1 Tax=Archangium sp. TaxID=1872627 RepID=UPI002E375453|nr:type I restriction-modification enzyme R subunit C-terminal domain-containing protein [Archangium sp.]HEX5746031.1 type I restriction-modification enzyme R subunit C-terminal domain-containing protein [Archangium sp.]
MTTPEALAREAIDEALRLAGWIIQDAKDANVDAGTGVAVREFPLGKHGFADYLLYINGKAAGVIEAKKAGTPLTGVELQTEHYSQGLPRTLPAWLRPLPFLYESTGVETRFTNRLDPEARSRPVFHFHRPHTLVEWLEAEPLLLPYKDGKPDPRSQLPATLRGRLQQLPALETHDLWPAQVKAIRNLETSLAEGRPRALIQMATGSGKTFTAVNAIYRLIKHGGARRVLFLVDRANLGEQALKEFQQFDVPDGNYKFTQEYNVQLLASNKVDGVARVCITTIQRLYSMLQGEPELDPAAEEPSLFDSAAPSAREPLPVRYSPSLPIETFDVIFTDECHRSIYNLWRQVLEYFDAFLVGLTATPSKQTLGFFHQNLVMEYGHAQAVADGVNVDFDVYRIRTEITDKGSHVEAGLYVDKRDRLTRTRRWQQLDDELVYAASTLDRDVVAEDQIRTVLRTFRDRLFTEIFPGRTEVPKTIIFAKDDSHADDIVRIAREEFARGNEFIQKITYRTTVKKPKELISEFRTGYHPRIAVTVDMIATGTDIKPVEIVMFMRSVRSRLLFEQMKGRGVRVISKDDLRTVTGDAKGKTRFVIVDCVRVCESDLVETHSLEQKPTVPLKGLLDAVGFGSTDPEIVSTLAGRLARLTRALDAPQVKRLEEVAGVTLPELVAGMVEALEPDRQLEAARNAAGLPEGAEPSLAQVRKAAEGLLKAAVAPLAKNPALRQEILTLKQRSDQTIDMVSKDRVLEAGFSEDSKEKAKTVVESFERFLKEHQDEITALQVLYAKPWAKRLKFKDIKALASAIEASPRAWTPERLWQAYETLDGSRVRGASAPKMLTDIVSLVRYALHQEEELVPFQERVEARFSNWMAQQENRGRRFTDEQREWLRLIKDQVVTSFKFERDDFDDVPFNQRGGLGKAARLFGTELDGLLEELNEVLVA